jgi:3-deoxy-D-manno-octulosonate 8-phosphate phosphatase (KDO 8-P phosphatase)
MHFNSSQETVTHSAKRIRLLLLDVDGVLTDGKIVFSNSGDEFKSFSTLDGHGIKMAMNAGIEVGIITGRKSDIVARRASDLGIQILVQGREDKACALDEILAAKPMSLEHICFVGDDFPDLQVMRKVGLSFSVPNGHADVMSRADAITVKSGGCGAVREITDCLLKAQDKYDQFLRET